MFVPDFPLSKLVPAAYNPRRIDRAASDALIASITELGIVKPILATKSGTIVAGHQRTEAARAAGLSSLPVYLVKDCKLEDEIRFNQIHNAVDIDKCGAVHAGHEGAPGWDEVQHSAIRGDMTGRGSVLRSEICKLVLAYGPFGCSVVEPSGSVIHGAEYALSCKILRIPCRVYRLPESHVAPAKAAFGRTYGTFSYDHIPKNDYVQTFAQLRRLRGKVKANNSAAYTNLVLPAVDKTTRILDFGAGQLDYAKRLRSEGYRITAWEPYPRVGSAISEDLQNELFDSLERELSANGRFDVVVLDYVLNSVTSMQAHHDVLVTVNAMLRRGGLAFFSGRRAAFIETLLRYKKHGGGKNGRRVEFLDENGFSSLFRHGEWFFQKFHHDTDAKNIARDYFGAEPETHRITSAEWQIRCRKLEECDDPLPSMRREFSLPLSGGRTLPYAERIASAWSLAMSKEEKEFQ